MTVRYTAFLFLLIISAFIFAPSMQQIMDSDISIVNINEIPEEESKDKGNKSILDVRFLLSESSLRSIVNLLTDLNSLFVHNYSEPSLKSFNPPPEYL